MAIHDPVTYSVGPYTKLHLNKLSATTPARISSYNKHLWAWVPAKGLFNNMGHLTNVMSIMIYNGLGEFMDERDEEHHGGVWFSFWVQGSEDRHRLNTIAVAGLNELAREERERVERR
ncbi:hypothetical protein P168DRAFT_124516 [Aspergillus campestris IBT 28561]|uniref:Uncharacterized protein n=1 Tax=Aspergillus campestris (strain IBT 28561) TaxID=1392248 RepID=A0A2I1D6G2_ASPC2|nr:uncharacterized protein P168DRAFT_124516 [Aspergillus campestris IBT 28561]PKY05455.1 hypothetical protein P168DRAFT_124516 [Aspergillus campestris IBT 28561]